MMAQFIAPIISMLMVVMMIRVMMSLIGNTVTSLIAPRVSASIDIWEGACVDSVRVRASVKGITDYGYYAITNWSDYESLVTSDNDVIPPHNVVVKPFEGSINHVIDIYPEDYGVCTDKYPFTVEVGWCEDSTCSRRHKVLVKRGVVNCTGSSSSTTTPHRRNPPTYGR